MSYKLSGMPCNSNGNFIDLSMPLPPHHPTNDLNDWTPYKSQLDFKIAEFLFSHNKMSGGDINILLSLWAALLLKHNDKLAITSHKDIYDTIDVTSHPASFLHCNCQPCT
jgi:hypothetical protein